MPLRIGFKLAFGGLASLAIAPCYLLASLRVLRWAGVILSTSTTIRSVLTLVVRFLVFCFFYRLFLDLLELLLSFLMVLNPCLFPYLLNPLLLELLLGKLLLLENYMTCVWVFCFFATHRSTCKRLRDVPVSFWASSKLNSLMLITTKHIGDVCLFFTAVHHQFLRHYLIEF